MSKPAAKKLREEKLEQNRPKFYYTGDKYVMEHLGKYIPLKEANVKSHLREFGIKGQEQLANMLCQIRIDNFVPYSGAVAGFLPGLHKMEDSDEQFLVTSKAPFIEAGPGDYPFIDKIIMELLGDPDQPDQTLAFASWLFQARRNVVNRRRRPLPALILVGPAGVGKSLLIDGIIKKVLGRSANAYKALSDTTNFNKECLGAELLKADDPIAAKNHTARTRFAQGLKSYLFAGSVRVEAKGRDALNMQPVQAVVVAVNEEAEHLLVLPQMDGSLMDKITLLRCRKAHVEGMSPEQIAGKINEELPSYIADLEKFEIPPNLRNTRTGAAAWQHPYVLDLLVKISPEEQLRELLVQLREAGVISPEQELPACTIQSLLQEHLSTKSEAFKLLSWQNACGTYLGRLGISSRVLNGQTLWKLSNLERKNLTCIK
jgi:hypothetical protein